MDVCNAPCDFELYDDRFVYKKINAVATIQGRAAVANWDRNFRLTLNIPAPKLLSQAGLVRRFKESGSKIPVDGNRTTDDEICGVILFIHGNPLRLLEEPGVWREEQLAVMRRRL